MTENKWLQRLYLNRFVVTCIHDLIVAGLSLYAAFFLRVGSDVFLPRYTDILEYAVPLFMLVAFVSYTLFGMYRGVWRYASVPDLITIVKANILAMAIFVPMMFAWNRLEGIPRTVPFIHGLILVMWLGGSRLAYRAMRSHRLVLNDNEGLSAIPVLVYGSGDEAEQFIRATKAKGIYRPVAILDEKSSRHGMTIHGVKVIGGINDLSQILEQLKQKEQRPQKIVLADKTAMELISPEMRQLVEQANTYGLSVVRLPKIAEMRELNTEEALSLQPIAIEDLLGRPQIVMNKESIRAMLSGKRILVTGAGGSIGSEIAMQVATFGPAAICLLDSSEHNLYQIEMRLKEEGLDIPVDAILADVRDADRLNYIFQYFCPHVVFHAAAYKHVPMIEHNPAEGVLTNVIGTRNVALAAQKCNAAAMVQISTDKAVNPTNVMGATKKLAEMLCQSLDNEGGQTRFMTVRFGNVLGSSGSVVPLFKRQLERGGPLTVTDPTIERFFMMIPEAVGLVLSASAYGLEHARRGQIFVLDMGKPIRIDDLARQMIQLAGLRPDVDIKIVYTGLRPGEKMYEELFNDNEKTLETELPSIQAAEPAVQPLSGLVSIVTSLERVAKENRTQNVYSLLAQVVPNYVVHKHDIAA